MQYIVLNICWRINQLNISALPYNQHGLWSSRKHAYIILTPLNPTFI